jgi:hypothetical protein
VLQAANLGSGRPVTPSSSIMNIDPSNGSASRPRKAGLKVGTKSSSNPSPRMSPNRAVSGENRQFDQFGHPDRNGPVCYPRRLPTIESQRRRPSRHPGCLPGHGLWQIRGVSQPCRVEIVIIGVDDLANTVGMVERGIIRRPTGPFARMMSLSIIRNSLAPGSRAKSIPRGSRILRSLEPTIKRPERSTLPSARTRPS